jgi:hypothetical protein
MAPIDADVGPRTPDGREATARARSAPESTCGDWSRKEPDPIDQQTVRATTTGRGLSPLSPHLGGFMGPRGETGSVRRADALLGCPNGLAIAEHYSGAQLVDTVAALDAGQHL